MKRVSILFVLFFLFTGSIFSQDSSKSNEIGVYFTSSNYFGIRYKIGDEKKIMYRITALSLDVSSSNSEYYEDGEKYESDGVGFGLSIGLEVPISITERLYFMTGPELSGRYSYHEQKRSSGEKYYSRSFNYGLGFIVGFAYNLNPDFVISAEVIPEFYYRFRNSSTSKTKSFGFELGTGYAGITIGYRF